MSDRSSGEMLAAILAVACGCSSHKGNDEPRAGSIGSGRLATKPPTEDMVTISAGDYLASAPAFVPSPDGSCTPEIRSRVRDLSAVAPWPDERQHVEQFQIDRHQVTCDEFAICAAQGACRELKDCSAGRPDAHLEDAIAYCRWRGAKLPTLLQWQAALRGPEGPVVATCERPLSDQTSGCTVTAKTGVEARFWGHSVEFTRSPGCWEYEKPGARPTPTLVWLSERTEGWLTGLLGLDARGLQEELGFFRCVRDGAGPVVPDAQ